MSHYYQNRILGLTALGILLMAITYIIVTSFFPPAQQTLVSSIAIAFEGFALGGTFQFLFEGRRMQHRDRNERIRRYHNKIRELVFIDWLHNSLAGYPSAGGTADLHMRPLLDAQTGAEERYFKSSLSHLTEYGLTDKRTEIITRIKVHNREVDSFEIHRNQFKPLSKSEEDERDRLVKDMLNIWDSAQKFGHELKGVIYDIEDETLKGTCDFERLVRG